MSTKRTLWVLVLFVLLAMVGNAGATLVNDCQNYTDVTAVNLGYYSTGAAMRPWSNWWMYSYNSSWESAYPSNAGISWNLESTKGSAYNFSGSNIQFNAMNSYNADGVAVQLLSDGVVKWQSSFQNLGGTHSFDVPVGSDYSNIDQILFVFRSTVPRDEYQVEMDTFTSTANVVPEPISLVLLASGALGLLRRKD